MANFMKGTILSLVQWIALAMFAIGLATSFLSWKKQPLIPTMHPQSGQFALITGASSGLGREMSYLLAQKGFSLIVTARNRAPLEAMRTDIERLHKVAVQVCDCDLGTQEGIDLLIHFVRGKRLYVDILINNAGAAQMGNFHTLTSTKVAQSVSLNVCAVVQLTHFVLAQMLSRRSGRVLNVSSVLAVSPAPNMATYASSKAFIHSFTQALRHELAGSGVVATCFCPGPMKTNFAKESDCQQSLCFRVPYLQSSPVDAAKIAVDGMFAGVAIAHDRLLTREIMFVQKRFLPLSLCTTINEVLMREFGSFSLKKMQTKSTKAART
uniref:Uncharacterized protein AlNc14C35G3150 n=1 Tax=Albugo laibachii Nc14 TaxID=890382 RepID=F0W8M5_9STRA|nr:conserved hypothetical protein [Albugo laibachii Nc14]|eukprot:CCA17481.1 conserved hypothetical protein [Albugo laibachii Nc14]